MNVFYFPTAGSLCSPAGCRFNPAHVKPARRPENQRHGLKSLLVAQLFDQYAADQWPDRLADGRRRAGYTEAQFFGARAADCKANVVAPTLVNPKPMVMIANGNTSVAKPRRKPAAKTSARRCATPSRMTRADLIRSHSRPPIYRPEGIGQTGNRHDQADALRFMPRWLTARNGNATRVTPTKNKNDWQMARHEARNGILPRSSSFAPQIWQYRPRSLRRYRCAPASDDDESCR